MLYPVLPRKISGILHPTGTFCWSVPSDKLILYDEVHTKDFVFCDMVFYMTFRKMCYSRASIKYCNFKISLHQRIGASAVSRCTISILNKDMAPYATRSSTDSPSSFVFKVPKCDLEWLYNNKKLFLQLEITVRPTGLIVAAKFTWRALFHRQLIPLCKSIHSELRPIFECITLEIRILLLIFVLIYMYIHVVFRDSPKYELMVRLYVIFCLWTCTALTIIKIERNKTAWRRQQENIWTLRLQTIRTSIYWQLQVDPDDEIFF